MARPGRPGGLIGVKANAPPRRYSRRTRKTVSRLQPMRSQMHATESRECDIKIIRQLRNTSADEVENRIFALRIHAEYYNTTRYCIKLFLYEP